VSVEICVTHNVVILVVNFYLSSYIIKIRKIMQSSKLFPTKVKKKLPLFFRFPEWVLGAVVVTIVAE
jgi:hypothetical protein